MTDRIEIAGLRIARELHEFVAREALPGTGIVYGTGSSALNGAFMSRHTGGANFLLGDGSVRFLSQNIDFNIYKAAASRNGGEVAQLD